MVDARDATVDEVVDGLDTDGYCIVERLFSADDVAAARTSIVDILTSVPNGRNDFEGFKTQRVYALFAKTRAFDEAAISPLLLGALDRTLEHYQLSAPVGIAIGPGEREQVLHYDQAIYPLSRQHPSVVINTMWALDDFTTENGATRIIPGSHRWPDDRLPGREDEIVQAVMPAGSVMFYGGKVWHGGGANHTDETRIGVILEYVAAWLRPQENHVLGVAPAVVATLPLRLQELLGYNIYPPFVGYVDGRHPLRTLPDR